MTERQSAQISKIKNGGLGQYGAEPFKQQQFGTAGVEGVNDRSTEFIMDRFSAQPIGPSGSITIHSWIHYIHC